MTIHANVTAYKGKLVIQLLTMVSIDNETAVSMDVPGRFGQVIMNTKEHLGVSEEALELLKTVKRGHDGLGDGLDWFKTEVAGQAPAHAFSWLGGPYAIVDPTTQSGSRDYVVGEYQTIPNDVPQGAKDAIDQAD